MSGLRGGRKKVNVFQGTPEGHLQATPQTLAQKTLRNLLQEPQNSHQEAGDVLGRGKVPMIGHQRPTALRTLRPSEAPGTYAKIFSMVHSSAP